MSKKGENIYKRKDGRWEGRYKKGRKVNGQLKYGYVYGKKYKEVKEKLYRHRLTFQEVIKTQGESAVTYEEWSNSWLKKRASQLKQSTYSTYTYKLTTYVYPLIGNIPLNQMTPNVIQDMVDQLIHRGLASSTIHVLYQIVKKSFRDAHDQQIIYQFPCRGIILPKKKRSQPKALARSEQKALESAAKALPLHQGLPVLLALNAGLRIGEVSGLRWKDIDLETKTIHVRQSVQRINQVKGKQKTKVIVDLPKTERSVRVIPMSFTVYKYLKKWRRKSTSPYVCSNKARPAEPRLIMHYFARLRALCDLSHIHFHHLRHTFATRCIESSSDVASVSCLLGHSSSKTTLDVYTDSLIEGRQRVIFQMDHHKVSQ